MKILMIVCYLIFTVSGLILMKKGGNAGKISISAGEFDFNISLISALGFVCYIVSFLLYTRIVMMFENLSFISPIKWCSTNNDINCILVNIKRKINRFKYWWCSINYSRCSYNEFKQRIEIKIMLK